MPNRKQHRVPFPVEWRDSARELFTWYRYERDGFRRTRLQALWLLRRGEQLLNVASAVGMQPRTVRRWLRLYEAGGIMSVIPT